MNHRERGAASVNVMAFIFALVVIIGLAATVWTYADERQGFIEEKEKAEKNVESTSAENVALKVQIANLSKVVGYGGVSAEGEGADPSAGAAASQPAGIDQRIKDLRADLGNEIVGAGVVTLEELVETLRGEIVSLQDASQKALDARDKAVDDQISAQDDLSTARGAHQTELTNWQTKFDEERALEKTRLEDANSRYDRLDSDLKAAEARERAAVEEAEQQVEEMESRVRVRDGRIAELAKKLEVLRDPQKVDGKVIAASANLGVCYIDLGTKDMLRRGTRFKVHRTGKAGVRTEMGVIEVRNVEEDRAECGIVASNFRYDPIAPGDEITAPLYDRDMQREFVLVGRFPTGYPKDLVADRLRSLGARVASKVSVNTDFLVVGDPEELTADDEEGEDPAESEEFRLAGTYKVQTLAVRDLLDFLRYD